jgi:hypothetical protein
MSENTGMRRGPITRSFAGPGQSESFILIAIATILLTRLYLKLTGYPQVGGGNLHIAHTLYGEALMMLALLIGWLLLGGGARNLAVVLGGIGFGLVLDEVGKFVTKDNDYFYGPAAEIMYVLVVIVLVGTRALRAVRPMTARECLASASAMAADGVARGLGDHGRELGLRLIERARRAGADPEDVEHVRALLLSAPHTSDHLYTVQRWILRLIPPFLKSPQWVPVLGWLIVVVAFASLFFHTLGVALGGYFYRDTLVRFQLAGMSVGTAILLVGALLTLAMALPATIALRRTEHVWPLRLLRDAALLFTLLSALVHFATEGFAALINLSIGLFAMAMLSYHLNLREGADLPTHPATVGERAERDKSREPAGN